MFKSLQIVLTVILFTAVSSLMAFAQPSAKDQLDAEIQKYKGDVIYLDFWASWCVPCRKSFPWMNKISSKYAEQGFTVISVNLDMEKALALDFLKVNNASFTVLYDPQGHTSRALKVKGMPSSYLINRSGKIVNKHTGFFTAKINEYEQEIETLLAHKN